MVGSRQLFARAAAAGVAAAVMVSAAAAADGDIGGLPAVQYLLTSFHGLGLGVGYSSAIRPLDDAVFYWGTQRPMGSAETTNSVWLALAGGDKVQCGIKRDTLMTHCWGSDAPAVEAHREIPALAVVVGGEKACALTFDIGLVDIAALSLKEVTAASVEAFLASVRPVCWGTKGADSTNDNSDLLPVVPDGMDADDAVVDVQAGTGYVCVRTFKGRVSCSGHFSSSTRADVGVPAEAFATLAGGTTHVCGVVTGGAMRCWGECSTMGECFDQTTGHGRFTYLAGVRWAEFQGSLSAGNAFTCGLTADLVPRCFGRNFWGNFPEPSTTQFIEIESGESHTCGIVRKDSSLHCWGTCFYSECEPDLDAEARLFATIPCGRAAASGGVCYKMLSGSTCEARDCSSGFQWQPQSPCSCYYHLGDLAVPDAAASARARGMRCTMRRNTPMFYLKQTNENRANGQCR